MDRSQQRRHVQGGPPGAEPEEPTGEGLDSMRRELERMMRIGDGAISAVLSQRSQDFLENSRQQSGQ